MRNEARDTGLWVVVGVRQVVYGKKSLSLKERLKGVAEPQRKEDEKTAAAERKRQEMAAKGVKF